jgi:serine O-acetyltransferase
MTDAITSDCRARGHNTLVGLWFNLSEDVARYLTKSPANIALGDSLKTRLSALLTPELLCLFLYRLSHYLYVARWHRLANAMSRLNCLVHRVTITPQSCIGPGCRLPHPACITFHGRAGSGLTLYSRAVCCPKQPLLDGPVELGPNLGERVSIGGHAVVMGPIHLGDDTKLAFTVWIDHDVPARSLVVSAALRQPKFARFTGKQRSEGPDAGLGEANEESEKFVRSQE